MDARYVIVHTEPDGSASTLGIGLYADRADADHRVVERRRTAFARSWADTYEVCLVVPAGEPLADLQGVPVESLLASVDNALRNGSDMNNANLAFELLCDRLGVDRETLVFDPRWSSQKEGR